MGTKFNTQLFVVIACLFVLAGCAERRQPFTVIEIAPPPPPTITIKYLETTIIEGKTTKTKILEDLGAPETFGSGDTYSYTTYSAKQYPVDTILRIRFIQRDGTDSTVTFGKHPSFVMIYYTNKGIVRNFSM
jgi:hypothetical protein